MDLSTIKKYFQTCCKAETELQESWSKLAKIPAYPLFKLLSPQSQPKVDLSLIRQFIITFNWQQLLKLQKSIAERPQYQIHSLSSEKNPEQLLDYGIELLINYWGTQGTLDFQQFCKLVKGEQQLPVKDVQVPFNFKKVFFQALMKEIQNIVNLELLKSVVYHQYKNLSDLFQTLTATNKLEQENIQRLFLSFSQRKTDKQIQRMCKRSRLPWDFSQFLTTFKKNGDNKSNQFKVYHSARRNKNQTNQDKAFTTPRKEKFAYGQSSTKLTKLQSYEQSPFQTPKGKKTSTLPLQSLTKPSSDSYLYLEILAELLQLQQQFINSCSELIKRKDFDLQLVYERHGKKFEKILNNRYGVCNFSAFVRFIVPRDYQHRYLSFIRYQSNDTLTKQTQSAITDILNKYTVKQRNIEQLWKKCDKQMLMRYFCEPKQQAIHNDKLKEYFTTRQTKVILQRLDPHATGKIVLEAIN